MSNTKKDNLIDDIFENQMRNWFRFFPSCGQSYRIVNNGKKVIITISNIKKVKKYPTKIYKYGGYELESKKI